MIRAPDEISGSDMPLTLTATGGEYFRLWIVNLFLSVITLGIYSAWARVRTLRYLYRNTLLDGHGFDFHADPFTILSWRIAIFVPAILLQQIWGIMPRLSMALAGLCVVALPWLFMHSLRFRLAHTSHRGLRFGFDGSLSDAYRVLLLWPLLALASFGMLAPVAYQRFKRYQHDHSSYGDTRFHLDLDIGSLHVVMFASIGMLATAVFAVFMSATALAKAGVDLSSQPLWIMNPVFLLPIYIAIFITGAFVTASLQNLVWSGTTLGDRALHLRSDMRTLPLLSIQFTNLLGMIITIGLFYPFARIRLLRFRLQQIRVTTLTPLDSLVSGRPQPASVPGDTATDGNDFRPPI